MDEDEVVLDLTTYPHAGDTSVIKSVLFGPASDKFAFLIEVDPETGVIDVTIGNAGATSEIPTEIPVMLREVAEEIENLATTSQFLEWVYGTQSEDEGDDD